MRAETTPSLPRRGGRTRIQRHADQAPTPVGKGIVREPRQKSKAERFPIIVAEWPRNSRELVRITLDRFKNHFTIDQRAWWQILTASSNPVAAG